MANLKGVIYMAKKEKNFEVVKKYYFRKGGIVENKGYDWIGEACFELYPVELDDKLGFADCNGKIVIPIIYDRQHHINDTVWTGNSEYLDLRKDKLYGLIKHDGTDVIEFQWEDMSLRKLSEDLLPVATGMKWGFVNVKTGKTQVQPAYDDVGPFKNGFAPVCIDKKWGMIDVNGNVIIKPKYLLDSHFVGDFAIMFEGGSYRYGRNTRLISDSNCKIVNKKGYEIVTDCSWIEKTGVNTFTLTRKVNGKSVNTVRQFIAFPDYIIVIDDGEYLKGYITTEGKYSEEFVLDSKKGLDSTHYANAKYVGGGTWSAIDYTGKTITIPNSELQKVKEDLIMNN